MGTRSDNPKGWRHHSRFSVGTLLIVVTILGIWLGIVVQHAAEQRNAVAIVTDAGGTVHYKHEARDWPLPHSNFSSSHTFDIRRSPTGPQWLRERLGDEYFRDVVMIDLVEKTAGSAENLAALTKLSGLLWLNLGRCEVTDDGLYQLGRMPQLRVLCLDRNRFTDEGVAHLRYLNELEFLDLSANFRLDGPCLEYVARIGSLKELDLQLIRKLDGDQLKALHGHPTLETLMIGQTPLRDEHLRHLSAIPNLKQLAIDRTKVTDEGVIYLADNFQLNRLYLEGPDITDRCLDSLAQMSSLEVLSLGETRITDSGIDKFKQAAPNCKVSEF